MGAVPNERGGGRTPALIEAVYDQLRGLARRKMAGEPAGLTLQTTALVHEVYLRLMKDPAVEWDSPRHFYGAAAEAMRRILIERARRHNAVKRGGGRGRVDLEAADPAASPEPLDAAGEAEALLELDDALTDLKGHDERLAEVVMLRYFAGLGVDETAAAVGQSPRTVKRDWAFARAWLHRRLNGAQADRGAT